MASYKERIRSGWRWFARAMRTPRGRAVLDAYVAKFAPWAILIFALIYYGNYFRAGMNLGGEGGTTAVLAVRLMEGQLPIIDTFLGYNLMWFYPVVWLFELVGPNYLALQLYFFVLCTLAALLGYAVVRRATGEAWFALLVIIPLVLIPGPLFRNYQAFLANLNMFVLLAAFVVESKSPKVRWLWYLASGVSIGLTYLVRIELGIFFSIIWLALIVLHPFARERQVLAWSMESLGAFATGAVVIVGLQGGMYLHADARGFGQEFAGQYPAAVNHLKYQFRKHFEETDAIEPVSAGVLPAIEGPRAGWLPTSRVVLAAVDDGTLGREGFEVFFDPETSLGDRAFVLLTYLPIGFAVVVFIAGTSVLIYGIIAGSSCHRRGGLIPLVTLGSALTLFPQFFFFRPDTPHLSEFMIPFIICLACTGWLFTSWAWHRSRPALSSAMLFDLAAFLLVVLHFISSFPKESSGSVAADHKRGYEFAGQNVTNVRLTSWEIEEVEGIYDQVMTYSDEGDWVICLPYSPTVNFMTDRPSYLHNLYVDNATAPRGWVKETIGEFETRNPAVVLIDNRDINGTEESRFRNWAQPVYSYLLENYVYVGTFNWSDLFVHPDRYRERSKSSTGTP